MSKQKKQQCKLKSVFKGNNQEKETEAESQEYNLFNFPDGNLPFRIQSSLNKAISTMEVDTGAMLPLISHATNQNLWPRKDTFDVPTLQKTTARLKSYAGV